MNTVLMWIGGLLAAVLAALFAVPYFIDWNGYRGVFEEEATRILGRDVRVGGKINVRLLPTPYLRFEKLRIADTRLGATEPLFRADSFTLWLSVPPLLQGNLEARHVALDKPVVTLAVDKNGIGNWTTLGIRPGTLPFVPQNVALQAVDISDGTLVLNHARAGEVGRLTGVSGVISAEALDGPYKFAGDVQLAGHAREVRIATAKADTDGTLRFKASASPKGEAGADYKLEGSLAGLSSRPEVSGALSAMLPLPVLPSAGNGAPGAGKPAPSSRSQGKAAVFADVKGSLTANPDALEIKDIVASIENVGQPQLLSGELNLEWGRQRRFDFAFTSRWLDFDRLAGGSGRASPAGTSATLIAGLTHALPEHSTTRGVVSVDQLTLGGAPLANLDLAVSRAGAGELRIERLFAELPAGGRLGLDGKLVAQGAGTEFDGVVTAAGPSLARLAAWGLPETTLAEAAPDGAFSVDGRLKIGPTQFVLSEAKGAFSDHPLSGAVVMERGKMLRVDISAQTFESEWLFAGGLGRTAVLDWIDRVASWGGRARSGPDKAAVAGNASDGAAVKSFQFKLTTATLRGPDRGLRDVVADIGMAAGELRINRLSFRAGDGLGVELGGQVGRNGGKAKGALTGSVRAEDTDAIAAALALFEVPDTVRTQELRDMAPVRLAIDVSLGQRMPDAIDVKADGTANAGRMTVRTNFDGGLGSDWRAAPAEITVSGEDTATARLMSLLFARTSVGADASGSHRGATRANVAIKAVGIPAQGMVTDAALSRDGLSLAYNGRTSIDAQAVPTLSGTLEVAADRLGDLLALVGVASAGGSNAAVTGTLGLSLEKDGRTKLTPSGLTVAGSQVSGMLRMVRGEKGRLKVDGDMAVDQASVAGLVASLVERVPRPVPVSAADLAFQEAKGLWTDQPFAAAAFDRFEGSVSVRFKHLKVAPGLGLSGIRLGLNFTPGEVAVDVSEGGMLGGTLRGSLVLAKAAAGARIKSELEAKGVKLAQLAQSVGSSLKADGAAAVTLAFSGQALSPRSLVTAMRGSGRVSFADAWIGGLSPQIVTQIISAAFDKQITTDSATLEKEVLERRPTGRLDIGSRDVGLEVADGALRLARFEIQGEDGRVEALATVDLSSLQAETEWRLVAASSAAGKSPWPPVSIFYTGALGAMGTTEPRVALGSFERELTVRRMEYEVEELERLRKEDEERARQERARLKAMEEARQRELELQRKQIEAERQRQKQLQEQQSAPLPQVPGPRSEAPGGAGGIADPSHAATLPGNAAPAAPDASGGQSGATLEPAAATATDASQPSLGTSAPAAASGTVNEATPTAPAPRPAARTQRPPRRSPSAGDTLLRSLNGWPN